MAANQPVSPPRRPYQKPRLRKIELVADEVMAVGCKKVTVKGPVLSNASCIVGGACYQNGS